MSIGRNPTAVLVAVLGLLSLNLTSARGGDTTILKGNHPREAATLTSVGDADPTQPLSMEIRFAARNQAELDQLLADQQNPASPNYHRWLATGEYHRRFGPRQADLDAVAEWLRSEGFTVESPSNESLKFSGTVAQAQRAFLTRIARFGDGSSYANVDDPAIPARFAGVIGSIQGLDNMTHAVPAAAPSVR
jgi:subtilase family serine protease